MKPSVTIIIFSFLCAVFFTVVAEKKWMGSNAAKLALVSLYGVCVGVLMALVVHVFAFGELAALAIGVPLGAVALIALAWMSG